MRVSLNFCRSWGLRGPLGGVPGGSACFFVGSALVVVVAVVVVVVVVVFVVVDSFVVVALVVVVTVVVGGVIVEVVVSLDVFRVVSAAWNVLNSAGFAETFCAGLSVARPPCGLGSNKDDIVLAVVVVTAGAAVVLCVPRGVVVVVLLAAGVTLMADCGGAAIGTATGSNVTLDIRTSSRASRLSNKTLVAYAWTRVVNYS